MCKRFNKHPDRLTTRDAQEMFIALESDQAFSHWEGGVKVAGQDSCVYRRALKDFLKSKGAKDWQLIGVGKPSGYGQYKDLWAEPETVKQMIEWVTEQNPTIGAIDSIMYHRGIRVHAVLTAEIAKFHRTSEWDYITVLEKFRETPTFKLNKTIGDKIQKIIGDRKEGRIFEGVIEHEVADLNREALKKFLPDLEPKIEMPNHFFRHMHAQHLRKLTKGNTVLCAAMMKCSKQSFDESYGGITDSEVEEGENIYLPLLGA
jgi:integrase